MKIDKGAVDIGDGNAAFQLPGKRINRVSSDQLVPEDRIGLGIKLPKETPVDFPYQWKCRLQYILFTRPLIKVSKIVHQLGETGNTTGNNLPIDVGEEFV